MKINLPYLLLPLFCYCRETESSINKREIKNICLFSFWNDQIVRSLDEPEKKPKEIDSWISSITDLHREKPPQTVHYTKTMPDIESLMQEWPPEFEEMLKSVNLPSAELDCDLGEYVDVICCKSFD